MNGISEMCSLNRTRSCLSKLKIMNKPGSKSKESLVFSCTNQKSKCFFLKFCYVSSLFCWRTRVGAEFKVKENSLVKESTINVP